MAQALLFTLSAVEGPVLFHSHPLQYGNRTIGTLRWLGAMDSTELLATDGSRLTEPHASDQINHRMPLPETIPVKYTEEEAESVSLRPVVRQTFRSPELVDMIVSVAGKDPVRVRQILRSGTIVFHSYRYWWQGFDPDAAALSALLARYPDAEPSRVFHAADCTEVILESSGASARHSLRLGRKDVARRRIFRARSFWNSLMDLARDSAPAYRKYSYALRADIFESSLSSTQLEFLAREAARFAPRSLHAKLSVLPSISRIVFICPRAGN